MIGGLTIQVRTPHKTDVHAQVAVVRRAVQAQIYTERHTRPGGIFRTAVKADLIRFLALQLVEDGVRDRFWR